MSGTGVRKKATNSLNQGALDHLLALSRQPNSASSIHLSRAFKRAIASLAKCPSHVVTYEQAMQLDGVGSFFASKISGFYSETATQHDSIEINPTSETSSIGALSNGDASQLLKRCSSLPLQDDQQSKGPSPKEAAFQKAKAECEMASSRLHEYHDWTVILLLDSRERRADHVQAKLLQQGVACEQRQLPIGDMLWVARGKKKSGLLGTGGPDAFEIVLGTVVERKTANDLAASLYGTRFEEQRLRLKHSAAGASQVIFLVEASSLGDVHNCSPATLQAAIMNTTVHSGFAVMRTKTLGDTIMLLRRVHMQVTKRSFAGEYSILMAAVDMNSRRRSIAESLSFAQPPAPFDERHVSYEELKATIELAREQGTRSVGSIFQAQLKQVDTMSVKKVTAIARRYRTPKELFEAYDESDSPEKMLEDVAVSNGERSIRIGPKSSLEVYHVYRGEQ